MIAWIVLIIALIGLDQLTKFWVVSHFALEGDTMPIIQDFFHFTYVRNSGAVFGVFQGLADTYVIFLVVMGIAIVIFSIMFIKNDFKDKKTFWYSLSLALLIAGAFGNAIDRIFQPDHNVVDFIDFRGIWSYVFNIADICLNVGIALFIFDQFILEPKRKKIHG
ncbi:MAG: signal peptidase II [Bacilli bacterium]|nr:signal peptidase II [Bacilli bacterium]MBN2877485.1 signal peptidase II [Bacilli bacterium]